MLNAKLTSTRKGNRKENTDISFLEAPYGAASIFCEQYMSYLVHLSAHIYRTLQRPTVKRKSILRSVYIVFAMFIFASCSLNTKPRVKKETIETRRFGVHVVQFQKESPSLVSAWYTDSPKNWVKFFVLNKSKSNTTYLPIGSEVFIPIKLVKKKDVMPESFVSEWRAKNGEIKKSVSKKAQSDSDSSKNETQPEEIAVDILDNDQLIENLVGVE